jgi:hypothetical protein
MTGRRGDEDVGGGVETREPIARGVQNQVHAALFVEHALDDREIRRIDDVRGDEDLQVGKQDLRLERRAEHSIEILVGLDSSREQDDRSPRHAERFERDAKVAARPEDVAVDSVRLADLRVDAAARRVWRGEREIDLSKTEFDLLELLVRNAGIVLDHSTIYDRIWGYDFGPDSHALDVYVGYLRRKIERAGPPLIHTVRGAGYILRLPRG